MEADYYKIGNIVIQNPKKSKTIQRVESTKDQYTENWKERQELMRIGDRGTIVGVTHNVYGTFIDVKGDDGEIRSLTGWHLKIIDEKEEKRFTISEEADKIINFVYDRNPSIPIESLISIMVQDGIQRGIAIAIKEGKRWCEEESEHYYLDSDACDPKMKKGILGNSGNRLVEQLEKYIKEIDK